MDILLTVIKIVAGLVVLGIVGLLAIAIFSGVVTWIRGTRKRNRHPDQR